jgi:formate-dependent nitrite reductase cytochrome c552 subunit
MKKMSYQEQLSHPEWKTFRLEVFDANNNTCEECGSTDPPFHAHHIKYIKGRKAWEYGLIDMRCLCAGCHTTSHDLDYKIRQKCLELSINSKLEVLYFVDGIDDFMAAKREKVNEYVRQNGGNTVSAGLKMIIAQLEAEDEN